VTIKHPAKDVFFVVFLSITVQSKYYLLEVSQFILLSVSPKIVATGLEEGPV
jgi:hypothetical protein